MRTTYLIVTANTRRELVSKSKSLLETLQSCWASRNKLIFDSSKTKGLLIGGGKKNLRTNPSIISRDIRVRFSPTLKHLGIVFDKSLNWDSHLAFLSQKVRIQSHSLRRLCARYNGLRGSHLKFLYKACIEKMITFAASAWYRSANCVRRAKLDAIQRESLLLLTRAYRSTSNHALQVISGCPPLHLVLSATKASEELFQLGLQVTVNDVIYRPETFEQKIAHHLRHPVDWKGLGWTKWTEDLSNSHQPNINIFTDGSKTDTGTAAAFVAIQDSYIVAQFSTQLGTQFSSFQAETQAILEAMEWINSRHQCDNMHYRIITDARQVLIALANGMSTKESILQIQSHYQNLRLRGDHISLHWCKGHHGIRGNILADLLAREAITGEVSAANLRPS